MEMTGIYALALFVTVSTAVPALANEYQGDKLPGTDSGSERLITCTEPRPEICTMDYRPVCAQLEDGSRKTFSNGCNACSVPAVKNHQEGPCE